MKIMQGYINFIDNNSERFIVEVFDFLRHKSISSQSEHKEDVRNCAKWLANHIHSLGLENVRVIETNGHPIVYADYLHSPNSPTILVYGHYDVQPVEPIELWDNDPFEPLLKDGKIYARGSSDDKGQLFIHLKAIETILRTNPEKAPNIKFVFEGEEEAGHSHLEDFIRENPEFLKCDTVVISDTEWFAEGLPSICYGLRGITFLEVKVIGPNRDLHSGSFGGAIDNPIFAISEIISKLKDKYGRVCVPGFYDEVIELSEEERKEFARLPFSEKTYCSELGINNTYGEIGYSVLERVWARPTIEINGIYGGYTGEGIKTIIPSYAVAKISARLVPRQDAVEIAEKIEKFLLEIAPPTVKIEIKRMGGGNPVLTPIDSIWVQKARDSLKLAFGVEPVFVREGGSIPICETFQSVLKAPPVLIGFGLPGDNIHSPNENFSVTNFIGGICAISIYYTLLGSNS
ncbi:MAG: dipeptidase [Ignavibacteria bacterium]|nr:dipeptidase [Ignavibacteria bacterium]